MFSLPGLHVEAISSQQTSPVLTEVHVLQPDIPTLLGKKVIWRGFPSTARNMCGMAASPSTTVTGTVINLL
jgi:hypothetical protein